MTDLLEIARNRPDHIGTHWAGCEEIHTECLIEKMADEIERLRDDRDSWAQQADDRVKDCGGFIAEIERLRARLSLSIDYVDGIPTGYGEDEIDRQQAEIERLRNVNNTWSDLHKDRLAEIDRLNALVTEYSNEITGKLMPEIDRLQSRTDALESHLRWIAEWSDRYGYQAMARRIEQVLADH